MSFVIFQPNGKITFGTPPILEQKDFDCPECGGVHDIERCPVCGDYISIGYGLMGGGMGGYKFCNTEECDWFYKILDLFEGCNETVN